MIPVAPESLLAAIRANDQLAVVRLLDEDASRAGMRASGGESLVLHAAYVGALALVPLLLRGRPLDACEAAALGDVAALRAAIENDDDARVRRSSDGWTPLHLAAFFGRDDAVALLIDHGAPLDAHATNATRNTPLHAALAGAARPGIVRRLILAGADVEARGAGNITPLHLAASRGDEALCDLLLARGADPLASMEDGTTPGALATARGFGALGDRLAMLAK
ncbi:ankyrin repeat domain-containing protein [Gemmatimonas sp.]|uniref:ankyrin repeat domain-containing protein n=1 Tax=Gemmatimonas sp. TaxID=1962908 RepID=UPI0025BC6A59|nr:ankyrin repeat domain-containing protein [Gemmatimonas sp.]MCA2990878.1 ankyrin repeat domain-containing protein [Gemmatimonas sp.]